MATTIHFIDVGQGNMVLIQCADGTNLVVDCNITGDNQDRVLDYVGKQIGSQGQIGAFICTHRDADHMRGVRDLHQRFPIGEVWDSGYQGTTTDSDEYKAYMQLRRDVGNRVIKGQTRDDFGRTRLRYLSAQDNRLPKDANDQGLVLKVEERSADMAQVLASAILPGDSSYAVWKDGIMKDYPNSVSCDILMAAHHGSLTFFDDPGSCDNYVAHIQAMKPAMTVISVGKDNGYGHPDPTALALYRKHSTGSNKGNKVFRTDEQHTMKLVLKDDGWTLSPNQ